MNHHQDCDVFQATIASEGPYGDESINPDDYTCYCPTPEPKRVTIMIDPPDEDGDYRVEVNGQVEYSSELAEILPDSKEVKEWLR